MTKRSDGTALLSTLLVWLHRCEDILLSIALLLTLGIAFGQVVLRNLAGSSLVWGDVIVRILVLWLGMLGAMIATRERKHISIDLISRYFSARVQLAVEIGILLFSALVCAIAGYFSLKFVISEYHAGEIVFTWLPAWACEAILPAAFILIAVRFALQSIQGFTRLRRGVRS